MPRALQSSIEPSRAHWIAPGLTAAAFFALVVSVRFPPMTDLPFHEGLVAILRHFRDSAFGPPIYELSLGAPNQLFYLLATALAYVTSVDMAVRVVVASSVGACFFGAARAARFLGGDPWAGLAIAPFIIGFLFYFGLVGNVLGLGIFLAAIPVLVRFVEERSGPRATAVVLGTTLLLFLAHESVAIVALVVIAAMIAVRREKPKVLHIVPFVLVGVLSWGFRWAKQGHLSRFAKAYVHSNDMHPYPRPLDRMMGLPNALFGSYPLPVSALLGVLVLAPVLLGAMLVRRELGKNVAADVRRRALFLATGALFVLYLVLPWSYGTGTMVYHRFLTPCLALLVVATAPGPSLRVYLYRATAFAVALATLTISVPQFIDSDQVNRDLDRALEHVERGAFVGIVHLPAANEDERVFSGGAMAARVLAERGGRVVPSFVESPIAPVRYREGHELDELSLRLGSAPAYLQPTCDFQKLSYLIAHSNSPDHLLALARTLVPTAKLVAIEGEWLVLESRFPRVSPTGPFEPCEEVPVALQ